MFRKNLVPNGCCCWRMEEAIMISRLGLVPTRLQTSRASLIDRTMFGLASFHIIL